MKRIPAIWQTSRLQIEDSTLNDTPQLMTIFNACSHVGKWDPTFQIEPEETFTELVAKSVKNGEENGRFQLQTIHQRAKQQIIDYYHCFHQNPQKNTLFISMFVLHPSQQKSGYGSEFIQNFSKIAQKAHYHAIWLDIYLKNWPALRFWIKSGFTSIIEMDGDSQHSTTSHTSLVLAKNLPPTPK